MSKISSDLSCIKAFVLDMDGVLSTSVSPVNAEGMPSRTVNVKDGYAMQYAVKKGYTIAIISGGASEAMTKRFELLGVQYIYMRSSDKVKTLAELEAASGISRSQMAYIGDDMPDIGIMQEVALSCAPADAVAEVKAIAHYISPCLGGYGVVRDLIEQTLKAQGAWVVGEGFGW